MNDVSLEIEKGEIFGIIGFSGAGKSTLVRCINLLERPTSGKVFISDEELTAMSPAELRQHRKKIGMIFQHYNLVSRLTAIENVLHGRLGYKSAVKGSIGVYNEEEKQEAFDLLEKVGLSEFAYTRCDELSGGQKQRVGIARALILCDEPIASLDPKSSKVVMDYLRQVTKELDIACLVNLHQVEVAIDYSDRIIGVNSGNVVFSGNPDELTTNQINQIYQSDELLV